MAEQYPNPFVGKNEKNPMCRMCFKLNFVSGTCEKYDKKLKSTGHGAARRFLKCKPCTDENPTVN